MGFVGGLERRFERPGSARAIRYRNGGLLVLPLLVAACASRRPDPEVPDLDGLVERVAAENEAAAASGSGASGVAGPAAAEVAAFCGEVARQGDVRTVGCLPLPMRPRGGGAPVMTALGEELADQVASELSSAGFGGWALDSAELSTRMARMNLDPVALYTLASVSREADRLGVDAVVFGTIDRQDGGRGVEVLRVRLTAYDLVAGRTLADRRFEIRDDAPGARRAFTLAGQSSMTWRPGEGWRDVEALADLRGELEVTIRNLARNVVEQLPVEDVEGAIYVPPADSEGFVAAVSRLRSAQRAYAKELDRRFEASVQSGEAIDLDTGVVVDDTEFPDLRSAEAYLIGLQETVHATPAGRFGLEVADLLTEELRPLVSPQQVIRDLGFTRWSDAELIDVEGWIATGGLARSKKARNMLADEGIALVLSTRFERIGENFGLRVVGLDLTRENLVASTYARIDGRFAGELGAALDADLER